LQPIRKEMLQRQDQNHLNQRPKSATSLFPWSLGHLYPYLLSYNNVFTFQESE